MLRALLWFSVCISQESNVVKRAEAFHCLEPQDVRKTRYCVRQQRLEVPRIRNDYVIWRKIGNGRSEPSLDLASNPGRVFKLHYLVRKRQFRGHVPNSPGGISSEEMLYVIACLPKEYSQFKSVHIAATSGRPIEKKA